MVSTCLALSVFLAPEPKLRNVLVFSKTAAFRHDSIPDGIKMFEELGKDNGFMVTATEDAAIFGDRGLGRFDAVVFLSTTGDVLNDEQQLCFESYLESGRGYLGIHAAADTEYEWPFYCKLVGASFLSHPAIQKARVKIERPQDHICTHLPSIWERTDEWYDYRTNPRPNVTVLASLDASSYQNSKMGADHPIMWKQLIGKSRAFYTGMGHTKETYAEPLFRETILRALKWVTKD